MPEPRRIAVYHGRRGVSGAAAAAALRRLGIPHAMITARGIAAGELRRYAAVVFPGGHSIRIGTAGDRAVRAYTNAGGGMVGICAGAQYGARMRLLAVEHHILRAAGILDLRLVARHPLTAGYVAAGRQPRGRAWTYSNRGRVRMRYANGGFFTARRGAAVIASLDEHGVMGAVVAGACGRGRVVLITPHPESTPPPDPRRPSDADRSQDPLMLFGNAVRFAARTGRGAR